MTRAMVPGEQDTRAVLVRVGPTAADPSRFALIGQADRPVRPGC